MREIMDEVNDMDKKFFKDFWNKRSAWTFGLCLTGVLVIGGIVAADRMQQEDQKQPETALEQAYLEEDDLGAEDVNDTLLADLEEEGALMDEEANASAGEAAADPDTGTDAAASSYNGVQNDNVSSNAGETNKDVQEDDAAEAVSGGTAYGEALGEMASSGGTSADGEPEHTAEAASAHVISESELLAANVAFDSEQSSLLWPSAGTILIDYSMDGTVYFPTLDQYKYNPALIISSETGNQVISAAKGIVETITTDEVTGLTMTVNIGNGYRLTYGQLKEAAAQEGDLVEAGDVLGYVSEPTRYYIKEGSNLFFEMTKDGEPVDPILYLE